MLQNTLKLFLLIFLLGCSHTIPTEQKKSEAKQTSPEADLSAPGMIPAECETLLQKSEEWGYHPGETWKPSGLEQAIEVANFFTSFTLVPESSSKFWNSWSNDSLSSSESAAAKKMELSARAQICDISLATTFLRGVIQFKWPKDSVEPKSFAHKFLLNQQARTTPLIVRALTIEILEESARKKYVTLNKGTSIHTLRTKLEKARNALEVGQEQSSLAAEKSFRRELELSEELRREIAKFLALP